MGSLKQLPQCPASGQGPTQNRLPGPGDPKDLWTRVSDRCKGPQQHEYELARLIAKSAMADIYIYIHIYIYIYIYIFIGYRLCRRPLKKSAGDDFWMPWPSWDAPCKPFETFGMHWADQGSRSRLFDTPVGAAAPVSGPGRGGGGLEVRRPVATCGAEL